MRNPATGKLINPDAYNKLLTVRISDNLQERINAELKKSKDISLGELVRMSLESYLKLKQKSKKE